MEPTNIVVWNMVEVGAWVVLVVVGVGAVRYWREVGEGVWEFKESLKSIDDLLMGPRR